MIVVKVRRDAGASLSTFGGWLACDSAAIAGDAMPPKGARKDEAHGLSCGGNDEYISLGIIANFANYRLVRSCIVQTRCNIVGEFLILAQASGAGG